MTQQEAEAKVVALREAQIPTARARLALKTSELLDRALTFGDDEQPDEQDATVVLKLAQAFITLTNANQGPKR